MRFATAGLKLREVASLVAGRFARASEALGVPWQRNAKMTDWEKMWSAGLPRGTAFDCAAPSASLTAWIERRKAAGPAIEPGTAALVPGAGRAYDAVALAEAGYSVTALDIAPTAVAEAQAQVAEAAPEVAGRVSVREADFFAEEGRYALVWDCTFLCALPKDMREAWADKHAELVQPGGTLISLVFPMFPEDHPRAKAGPPFNLDCATVRGLLEPRGFTVKEEVDPLPEDEMHMRRGPMATVSSALLVFTRNTE